MEIIKTDARTVSLERYAIERGAPGEPLRVRAWLLLTTPDQKPAAMRVRVDYECDDISYPKERDLGNQIVRLLARRLAD